MTLHLTATDLAVVLAPVTSLLALWLRLVWRTRQEHARRGTLVDLAHTMRPGSELEETAADGTHLRIILAPSGTAVAHGRRRNLGPVVPATMTVGERDRR
jgi:hypothetical protein